LGFKKCTEI